MQKKVLNSGGINSVSPTENEGHLYWGCFPAFHHHYLSSSPFLFPEGRRSSSHICESHWVQDCQESSAASLSVTQGPEAAVMMHPTPSHQGGDLGSRGCCWVVSDGPSSMSLEQGWWGVVELRQRGSRACHNLSVLCSCRAYLRSLKAVPLHDLCPLGKCHELLFTAYWGAVAGRLSQVRRVRHGAPCGRIILCVLTTISYHQIYLNYSRINRDQTSKSVVWISRTRPLQRYKNKMTVRMSQPYFIRLQKEKIR